MRYRLGISHRRGTIRPGQFWQADLAAEAFIALWGTAGQFEEQARVTFGIDRSFKYERHLRVEVTWQQERLILNLDDTVTDIYFRLRFYQTWGNMR